MSDKTSTNEEVAHGREVKDIQKQIEETHIETDPSTEEQTSEHKITQTDRLNKKLLGAFLDRLNNQDNILIFVPTSNYISKVLELVDNASLRRKIATNSGKTSTTGKLCKYLSKVKSLCQDDYFLDPGDPRLELVPELKHANWEKLSAFNMETMMEDVNRIIEDQRDNKTKILIIEGILIFNHRSLTRLFDRKYFLTLDRDTCHQRRSGRSYEPADPPLYFEKIVWPYYQENMQEIGEQTDICYLNGTTDQEITFEKIKHDILVLLNGDTNK